MPNLAHIVLTGHLGRDPETRHTQAGKAITSFSLAVKTGYGEYERTTWWNITCFGKTGETAEKFLTKGQAVCVIGEPSLRGWKDKEGNEKQTLEVSVDKIVLLGTKDERAPSKAPEAKEVSFDDDQAIPF